jgi:nascent polypeptide-associated complex subunit alpha
MLPFSLDPKKMNSMLKQLGLKQEEIEAEEVIIKCKGKKLIIKNPNVTKMNVQGQEMIQVTGNIEESEDISEYDIKMVAEQANVSENEAKEALKKSDGNLAEAILLLKK